MGSHHMTEQGIMQQSHSKPPQSQGKHLIPLTLLVLVLGLLLMLVLLGLMMEGGMVGGWWCSG
jgi:hypothetical protein